MSNYMKPNTISNVKIECDSWDLSNCVGIPKCRAQIIISVKIKRLHILYIFGAQLNKFLAQKISLLFYVLSSWLRNIIKIGLNTMLLDSNLNCLITQNDLNEWSGIR